MDTFPAFSPNGTPPYATLIENRTYDEIAVGDTANLVRTLTQDDIDPFAIVSGDLNPAHLDPEFAKTDPYGPLAFDNAISPDAAFQKGIVSEVAVLMARAAKPAGTA